MARSPQNVRAPAPVRLSRGEWSGRVISDSSQSRQAALSLPDLLHDAIAILDGLALPVSSLGRLTELLGRLVENRLHIAVLGQFKRGKSSLLNALLGAEVLPTAVLPLTSVPIFITSGQPPSLLVHYQDERPVEAGISPDAKDLRDRLYAIATEEANPHNRLGIAKIDIRYPAPLLAEGTVLIDTPGIGSSHRHNTDTTLRFLPQCDVGLFVLSPDPPVTEVELAFLDEVKTQVPRLVFVLNKADYLDGTERETVVEFLRRVLAEQLRVSTPPDIHCISARQALAGRDSESPALIAESGLPAFEDQVLRPLARQKVALLQAAIARKAQAALADARQDVELAIGALKMPLADLERCLASFQTALPQFETQRQAAQDVLAGDRKRMLAMLEDEARQLRQRAANHLAKVVDAAFAECPSRPEPVARKALADAIPAFFDDELGRLSTAFTCHMSEVFTPHQLRAAELIDSVRRTAAELFSTPWQPMTGAGSLELSKQPYWVTQEMVGALIPTVGGSFDWLRPPAKRLARMRQRLLDDANKLVMRNVENLRWATLQNVETAFRHFGSELDRGLASVIGATHGSIATVFERRQSEVGRIDPQLDRLMSVSERLAIIRDQIALLSSENPQ